MLFSLALSFCLPSLGVTTNICLTATNCAVGETIACSNGNLLVLGSAVTNAGTLAASSGGKIEVYGPTLNSGTVSAVDGVIRFHGAMVNEGAYVGTNIFSVTRVPQLYFQNDAGVVARWTLDRFGAFQYSQLLGNMHEWILMAAADIDGDGIDDLIWQTPDHRVGIWFMNENFTQRDARFYWNTGEWEVRACSSSTGPWRAALLFQRPDGMAASWDLAADGHFLAADLLGNQHQWQLRGAAPHQRYSPGDLLWQRPDGGVSTWRWEESNTVLRAQWFTSAGDWVLRGSVDIDGDGTADLLWQTPDFRVGGWLMNSNGTPQEAHFWWQTHGWHLRAAGIGQLAYPLNSPTPPDANDAVDTANRWLTIGGTLRLTGSGSSMQTNCILALGNLSFTQQWGSAGGGFAGLLGNVIDPSTGSSPPGTSGTVITSGGSLTMSAGNFTAGSGILILNGGTLTLGSNIIHGTLSGIPNINVDLSAAGWFTNLNATCIHYSPYSFDLSTLFKDGCGVITWPDGDRFYTNNTLVGSVTLQLETNVSGAISGTLNPETDALALGTLTVSNVFRMGSYIFRAFAPDTPPVIADGALHVLTNTPPSGGNGMVIYTGGILSNIVLGGSGTLTFSNIHLGGSGVLTITNGVTLGTGMLLIANGNLGLQPGGNNGLPSLNGCSILIGTNRYDLSTVLIGGNGVICWPGSSAHLYTNNVLVAPVILQLATNEATSEITGTLNPETDNVTLGAMAVTNLITVGSHTVTMASPLIFPGIIYTNGALALQSPGP